MTELEFQQFFGMTIDEAESMVKAKAKINDEKWQEHLAQCSRLKSSFTIAERLKINARISQKKRMVMEIYNG